MSDYQYYEDESNKEESPFTIDPTAALSTSQPAKPKPMKAGRTASVNSSGTQGFIGRQAPKASDDDLTDDEIRAMRRSTTDAIKKSTAGEDVSEFVPQTQGQKLRRVLGPALTLSVTLGIGLVLLVAVGMTLYGMVAQHEAQNMLQSAKTFLKQGNPSLARRHLEPLIEGGSKDPAIHSLVGVCSNKLNDPSRALEEFTTASRLAPKDPAHLCGKAEAYIKLDKPTEAINEANAALALDPNFPDALRFRAAAHAKLNEFQKALDDSGTYLKLSSSPAADVYATRAVSYFNLKKFEEAASEYNHAVQLEPENGLYWTDRAEALKEAKSYKEAIAAVNRAISIAGKQTDLLRLRGACHLASGTFDEAIKDYELICQLSRKKEDYIKCADVAASGKRFNLALFYYTTALESNPDDNAVRAKKDQAKKSAGL
jgi:tetratricopeptide (TPR) repeat protein